MDEYLGRIFVELYYRLQRSIHKITSKEIHYRNELRTAVFEQFF